MRAGADGAERFVPTAPSANLSLHLLASGQCWPCVHAGSWVGERPHHGLLSLCAISERGGAATRCPPSQIEPPLERPDVRPLLGDSQMTVPRSRTQRENSTIIGGRIVEI